MNKQNILAKIRKCMALAASSNANEAATALRQAQKLMARYGITDADVRLADVSTAHCTTAVPSAPPWMVGLSKVVARAFRCEHWYTYRYSHSSEHVEFCGVGAAPELAAYSFSVLRRHLAMQRSQYYRGTRGKRNNRIRRADDFAKAWVIRIHREVARFAEQPPAQVLEFKGQKGLIRVPTSKRGNGKLDGRAAQAGWDAAAGVSLQHGMPGSEQGRIGSGVGS